jgi:hypothetical protein
LRVTVSVLPCRLQIEQSAKFKDGVSLDASIWLCFLARLLLLALVRRLSTCSGPSCPGSWRTIQLIYLWPLHHESEGRWSSQSRSHGLLQRKVDRQGQVTRLRTPRVLLGPACPLVSERPALNAPQVGGEIEEPLLAGHPPLDQSGQAVVLPAGSPRSLSISRSPPC